MHHEQSVHLCRFLYAEVFHIVFHTYGKADHTKAIDFSLYAGGKQTNGRFNYTSNIVKINDDRPDLHVQCGTIIRRLRLMGWRGRCRPKSL